LISSQTPAPEFSGNILDLAGEVNEQKRKMQVAQTGGNQINPKKKKT
jgi:hypothetical protein